jgi:transmembrane sensor
MPDRYEHIAELLIKDLNGRISRSELRELDEWLSASKENRQFRNGFRDWDQLLGKLSGFAGMDEEADWITLTDSIPELRYPPDAKERTILRHDIDTDRKFSPFPPLHALFPGKPGAYGLAAMALILLFASLAGWYLFHQSGKGDITSNRDIRQSSAGSGHSREKTGGSAKAYMEPGNGPRIDLDTVSTGGLICRLGNTDWFKTGEDEIRGQPAHEGRDNLAMITVTTTHGRNFCLILPDGSRAWINTGSSLRIPVSFDAGSREIGLTGEAYFEIAHQSGDHPPGDASFTVHTAYPAGNMDVVAHGTAFDISAYPGDGVISTTLVKGTVDINWAGRRAPLRLREGRELRLHPDGRHEEIPADTAAALSWKAGGFVFKSTGFREILGQLSRWYGKEIMNKDSITEPFSFTANRSDSLPSILNTLKGTGHLDWHPDGDKFIITRRSHTMAH